MITIKNIHKSFNQNQILRGVDLSIKKGTVTVILGPSGSGKTTFLRSINALEMPEKGQIIFDDQSLSIDFANKISKQDLIALRSKSGMVFQSYNLFPHKTALENVIEAPIYVQKRDKNVVKEEALALFAKIGLLEKINLYPYQLSGGQQQRVGIARALALKPQLMLFDEPTSALDPELVKDMLDLIKSLAKEGWTMVIVTHEINFAGEVADQVVVMEAGKIVEQGDAKKVFLHPEHQRTKVFLQALKF